MTPENGHTIANHLCLLSNMEKWFYIEAAENSNCYGSVSNLLQATTKKNTYDFIYKTAIHF